MPKPPANPTTYKEALEELESAILSTSQLLSQSCVDLEIRPGRVRNALADAAVDIGLAMASAGYTISAMRHEDCQRAGGPEFVDIFSSLYEDAEAVRTGAELANQLSQEHRSGPAKAAIAWMMRQTAFGSRIVRVLALPELMMSPAWWLHTFTMDTMVECTRRAVEKATAAADTEIFTAMTTKTITEYVNIGDLFERGERGESHYVPYDVRHTPRLYEVLRLAQSTGLAGRATAHALRWIRPFDSRVLSHAAEEAIAASYRAAQARLRILKAFSKTGSNSFPEDLRWSRGKAKYTSSLPNCVYHEMISRDEKRLEKDIRVGIQQGHIIIRELGDDGLLEALSSK